MTYIKKIFLMSITFFAILFLTACDEIKVNIYTEIDKDGSALRQIEYSFKPYNEDQLDFISSNLPDIFSKGFVLPSEPDWAIKKYIKNGTFYYIAERKISNINNLTSDYYKKGQFNGISQNFTSYDCTEDNKSIKYNYLEVFRDCADIVKFFSAFSKYIKINQHYISQGLQKNVSGIIPSFKIKDSEKVIELIIDKSREANQEISDFKMIGPKERTIIKSRLTKLDEDLKINDLIDYLQGSSNLKPNSKLTKLLHLDQIELNQNQKSLLLNVLSSFLKKQICIISIENNIEPFGAFYTDLDMFNKYKFEYTLKLPGTIYNSNGSIIDKNTAHWEFEPEDFFNHDYPIIAKSLVEK